MHLKEPSRKSDPADTVPEVEPAEVAASAGLLTLAAAATVDGATEASMAAQRAPKKDDAAAAKARAGTGWRSG